MGSVQENPKLSIGEKIVNSLAKIPIAAFLVVAVLVRTIRKSLKGK